MKITTGNGGKVAFFSDLYEEAKTAAAERLCRMDDAMAQYGGTPLLDGEGARVATQVRNITYELIESEVDTGIPSPRVTARFPGERHNKRAAAVEKLLSGLRKALPYGRLNNLDERYAPIYGGSVWLLEWDNDAVTGQTVGEGKLTCLSPKRFFGQPGILDVQDMAYCFLDFETTVEDLVSRYGEKARDAQTDGDRTATLHVCFYKNEEGRVCRYVWTGEQELSDIEGYFARKHRVCPTCGASAGTCGCGGKPVLLDDDGETVSGSLVGSDRDEVFVPYYEPRLFPIVIRKNVSGEDGLFGSSDCEVIRPEQQGINKLESRIMEKLLHGGVFPIVPENFREGLDNSIFRRVFRASAANAKIFSRLDLQADISGDVRQSERLYDQAKRILGISDSFQGMTDTTAQSGKAKEIQIAQAAGRLGGKKQMKRAAYAAMDKILFSYYLAYADEPRPTDEGEAFSRYDFVVCDENGRARYDDDFLFDEEE